MKSFLQSDAAHRLVGVVVGVVIVGVALAVGRYVPTQPTVALGVSVAVLALGLTVVDPAVIPLLAMPLVLVVHRIGAGGLQLSVSDAALFAATMAALVFTPRPFSPALRNLLWLSAAYQFATLFTVIVNPYLANTVEWFHAWMLVSGALIVGWTIGRSGFAKLGMSLLLVTALVLALVTLGHAALQYARGDFSAVYLSWPYPMHKNFVGTVLGFAAAIAYVRPTWMGWGRVLAGATFWIASAGVIVTQSRQAIIGLGVAVFVVALRRDNVKRSTLAVVAVVPAMIFVATLVRDQLASGDRFNSIFQRVKWIEETLSAWAGSPWVGHGLRYWYQPGELAFQPPNAELEVLASAGIVGLVFFLVLLVGALVVLWRVDPAYGTLAVAMILSRLAQSQFDLYWAAVQGSLPWLVAGICLGALARAEADAPIALPAQARVAP